MEDGVRRLPRGDPGLGLVLTSESGGGEEACIAL